MTFGYGRISKDNSRRFVRRSMDPPAVLAVYFADRAHTQYSEVGTDEHGDLVFASTPHILWPEEVEELR